MRKGDQRFHRVRWRNEQCPEIMDGGGVGGGKGRSTSKEIWTIGVGGASSLEIMSCLIKNQGPQSTHHINRTRGLGKGVTQMRPQGKRSGNKPALDFGSREQDLDVGGGKKIKEKEQCITTMDWARGLPVLGGGVGNAGPPCRGIRTRA